MTKPEPHTKEELADFAAQVTSGVGVMLTNGEAASLLATLEQRDEALSLRDARIEELEKTLQPFAAYAAWELKHNLPASIVEDDGTPVHGPEGYDDAGHYAPVYVGDLKRAAIKAINASGTHVVRKIEPTEAMIQAGCDEGPVGCCPLDPDMVVAINRAMLKASQGDE